MVVEMLYYPLVVGAEGFVIVSNTEGDCFGGEEKKRKKRRK
jgi:hypothetical protein